MYVLVNISVTEGGMYWGVYGAEAAFTGNGWEKQPGFVYETANDAANALEMVTTGLDVKSDLWQWYRNTDGDVVIGRKEDWS